MVKLVSFSMAGMCHGPNSQLHYGYTMSWSNQTADSAWLECVTVKNVRFSMAGMCCGQKRIQHGWNVLCSETSDSALLERVVVEQRQIQHG
jgi:hypothetical protein